MHAMSDKKLNELSLTQEMMTIRVQKYTDLANKLKNMEAIAQLEHKSTYTDISNKISITDLMFLNICHKGKIQELLGDQDKYLITKYSNIKFLNILELMGVCHIPAKADEVQHSLLLDLPTEVVVVILCYLTLADMHKIAGQHYLSNGKAPLIDVDMTFIFEEIHSEDGITTPLSGEVSAG
jgi:hypothetical protein